MILFCPSKLKASEIASKKGYTCSIKTQDYAWHNVMLFSVLATANVTGLNYQNILSDTQ